MQIFLVQDGRVEGYVLISSCEGTQITTSCWVTINRTLEIIKKDTPHSKTRSHSEMVGGAQSWWNQIPYPLGGWPTNWRTITPKKLSHCCEPQVGLPSQFPAKGTANSQIPQGIWPWRPAGLDYKTSTRLGETWDSSLGGHKQNFPHTKTQRKGASVGGSPVEEVWVRKGSPQGWAHLAWKVLLGVYPLGGCQHPTIDLEGWVALGQKNTREGA